MMLWLILPASVLALLGGFSGLARAGEQRLNYQQEKLLIDAISYLDEAENYLAQLEQRTKDLKVGDVPCKSGQEPPGQRSDRSALF